MAINFQHAAAVNNNVRLALETAMNTILDGVRQELEANGGTVLVERNNGEQVEVAVDDIYWDYEMCEVRYCTDKKVLSYYDLAGDHKEDE